MKVLLTSVTEPLMGSFRTGLAGPCTLRSRSLQTSNHQFRSPLTAGTGRGTKSHCSFCNGFTGTTGCDNEQQITLHTLQITLHMLQLVSSLNPIALSACLCSICMKSCGCASVIAQRVVSNLLINPLDGATPSQCNTTCSRNEMKSLHFSKLHFK